MWLFSVVVVTYKALAIGSRLFFINTLPPRRFEPAVLVHKRGNRLLRKRQKMKENRFNRQRIDQH
jgi:hypothetical protein